MEISFENGKYKSITAPFKWENIPSFAVVTGVNGSGKSQLLNLIASQFTMDDHHMRQQKIPKIVIKDSSFKKDEVYYVSSNWVSGQSQQMDMSSIQQTNNNFIEALVKRQQGEAAAIPREGNFSSDYFNKFINSMETLLKKPLNEFTQEEIESNLPAGIFYRNNLSNANYVAQDALSYYARSIEMAAKLGCKTDSELVVSRLGKAPWDVINSSFESVGIKYKVNSPSTIAGTFEFLAIDAVTGAEIKFQDLSTGEQALMSLIFWLYTCTHRNIYPKLMILDEPDAHLHPSLTYTFIDILQNIFVKKFGIRVIMSTHSPNTVSYIPEECLFEMQKTNPRILPVKSKNETIAKLTANMTMVISGAKKIFVEDEVDAEFYATIYSIFRYTGKISALPSLMFLSISNKNSKETGGKSRVKAWIQKFKDLELESVIKGLVDKDKDEDISSDELFVIERYSIENYLLDPINIYAVLVDSNKIPDIEVPIAYGDESKISSLNDSELQKIVDFIVAKFRNQADEKSTNDDLKRIHYINGRSVEMPSWYLNLRGKDLLSIAYNKIDNSITAKNLLKLFSKTKMVPEELLSLFVKIQASN
jgi:predicted ATPase